MTGEDRDRREGDRRGQTQEEGDRRGQTQEGR